MSYLVALAVLGTCVLWIVYFVLRRPRPIAQLVEKVRTSRCTQLFPFVEGCDLDRQWDDDALWAALGGASGLWSMFRECGSLIAIAQALNAYPQCRDSAEEILSKTFYLYAEVLMCLFENRMRKALPWTPRLQARSCARLYCDIATSLEAVLQICDPTVTVTI